MHRAATGLVGIRHRGGFLEGIVCFNLNTGAASTVVLKLKGITVFLRRDSLQTDAV